MLYTCSDLVWESNKIAFFVRKYKAWTRSNNLLWVFGSMPWLKRKSFSCLQIETDEVYNATFRLQKLQWWSMRQLKAAPEPRFSHPLRCIPPFPFVTCPAHPRSCTARQYPLTCPTAPSPASLRTGKHFLHCWELDWCPYLFGSPFSNLWPHGVVFVTSLLLPFIITRHWLSCVFSNAV